MVSRTDMERLLCLIEAHYMLLKARSWLKTRTQIFTPEMDLMLGATIELSCEYLRPAMEEADLLSVDFLFDGFRVGALRKLLWGILEADPEGNGFDEDEFVEEDDVTLIAFRMVAGMQFNPCSSKRRAYQKKLREKLRKMHFAGEAVQEEEEEEEEKEKETETTSRTRVRAARRKRK